EVSSAQQSPQGPIKNKRSADTTVLINDGETLVIGGLTSETDTDAVRKVPLLGDIPVVGDLLFKTTLKRKEKTELLVFVSPKIVTN
ncbi:MAG: hypothetical protein NZ870_03965, partial [bacterium]|nr:hypothetical protein [bacterium]